MKSPKNYVILLLLLTTVAGGVLAWQQYNELIKLRADAMTADERADWRKKLWDSEKKRHELESALAAAHARGGSHDNVAEEGPDGGPPEAPAQARRRGGMAGGFFAMMDKPEIQKLMAIQQRGALDARYAALFKKLNLSPEQLEKFKNLLVEKQSAVGDVIAAARAQGVDPRSDPQEMRKLIADAQSDVESTIKSALGDANYAEYQQYQQTMPQRNTVTQLEQSLSYTSAPLSSSQSDALVQILAANSAPTTNAQNNRAAIVGGFGIGGSGPSAPISDATIQQASSVLSPSQVQALQQLQQTQQAQAQLAAAMRNQFGGGQRTGGTTSGSTSGTAATPRPGGG